MPLQTDAVAVLCSANLEVTLANVSKLSFSSQDGTPLRAAAHSPLPSFMGSYLLVINRGQI